MTKKEMYNAIRVRVADDPDMVAFIDHEIELLEKRTNTPRKPSKVQIENETFKSLIVEYLTAADSPQTIKDIQAGVPELEGLSNQKMTHLLTPLVNDGVLIKTYEKKVPYFTIAQ